MTLDPASIVEDIPRVSLLVTGDIILDRYIWGDSTRISPEAPVPVVNYHSTTHRLGGAANAAANARSLGANVKLVGVLGEDTERTIVERHLADMGIASATVSDPDRPTTVKTRIFSEHHQVARIDFEDASEVRERQAGEILSAVKEGLPGTSVVLISDYGKGVVTNDIARGVIAACRAAGCAVVVDPKSASFQRFAGATILTPNVTDLSAAARTMGLSDLAPPVLGQRLARDLDLGGVLVTMGREGMTLVRPNQDPLQIPTRTRTVYDVTGAGDTVAAALAVCLAVGRPVETAAEFANLAAGIAVEHPGTYHVGAGDLLAFRSDRPNDAR